jgi:hypothetical protein
VTDSTEVVVVMSTMIGVGEEEMMASIIVDMEVVDMKNHPERKKPSLQLQIY